MKPTSAGWELLKGRDVEAALAAFRLAVDEYPRSPSAHEGLGDALLEAGDVSAAAESYRRMSEIAPVGLPAARSRLRLRRLRSANQKPR